MIENDINSFIEKCKNEELGERTTKQYTMVLNALVKELNIQSREDITKEILIEYKNRIVAEYKTSTVNNKIIIINKFLMYLFNCKDYNLKQIKTQNRFELDNVLTTSDYKRMLDWAMRLNKITMYYLMKTLAGTGIRIGELKYITVEAVKKGRTELYNKGKKRPVYIKDALQKELKTYCKSKGITEGIIFASRNGTPLDSAYIYKEMQYIARTSKS